MHTQSQTCTLRLKMSWSGSSFCADLLSRLLVGFILSGLKFATQTTHTLITMHEHEKEKARREVIVAVAAVNQSVAY